MQFVDESIKKNKYFVDKQATDINPDFSDYKLNNYQAFRLVAEIIDRDGDLSKLPQPLKEYFDILPGELGSNLKNLQVKLKQFANAWHDIKQNAAFRTSITTMATGFFSYWGGNYAQTMKYYRTRDDVPTYFDLNQYLNTILDKNGNFVEPPISTQKEYASLVSSWRIDMENEYANYLKQKGEGEVQ